MPTINVNMPDKSYHRKLRELAKWYYEANPDGLPPEELVRFNKTRFNAIIIRSLIDREYSRMTESQNNE